MEGRHIGSLDEFEEGEGKKVDADGIEIAVFKLDGEIYAIMNRCIHNNLPIHFAGQDKIISTDIKEETRECYAEEKRGQVNKDELTVRCPWHYMEWDLETGKNDLTGKQVPTFDVEIEDNEVYVNV